MTLPAAWDLEVFYGERVAILGGNGTGKSHFLRLLGGWPTTDAVATRAAGNLVHGSCLATSPKPTTIPNWLGEVCRRSFGRTTPLQIDAAVPALRRYELMNSRERAFDTLSGGQQARFQILLLELSGATMLLLDEPTDNLDVDSAEALEAAIAEFDGTVLAVTHDRWLTHSFGLRPLLRRWTRQ